MKTQTILDRIDELPRIKLAYLNTPFEEAPNLRAAIADSMDADVNTPCPQLFIKRDDATGFAFGGNKARHMEFLFAHLIDRGFDTIVNINHYHSNQARFVAASSAKMGLKCHMVAVDMIEAPVMGNLLIGHLTGAEIHRVPSEYSRSVAEKLVNDENEKRPQRHHPLRQRLLRHRRHDRLPRNRLRNRRPDRQLHFRRERGRTEKLFLPLPGGD